MSRPVSYVELQSPDLAASRDFFAAVFGWDPQPFADAEKHGGTVVVPPFAIGGVGRGAYVTDPAGVLVGLHMYDPAA